MPEQAACLSDQINCFTRVVTWYVIVQVVCSKIQASPPNTIVFVIVIVIVITFSSVYWKR